MLIQGLHEVDSRGNHRVTIIDEHGNRTVGPFTGYESVAICIYSDKVYCALTGYYSGGLTPIEHVCVLEPLVNSKSQEIQA